MRDFSSPDEIQNRRRIRLLLLDRCGSNDLRILLSFALVKSPLRPPQSSCDVLHLGNEPRPTLGIRSNWTARHRYRANTSSATMGPAGPASTSVVGSYITFDMLYAYACLRPTLVDPYGGTLTFAVPPLCVSWISVFRYASSLGCFVASLQCLPLIFISCCPS
jgi:hypothetical protein